MSASSDTAATQLLISPFIRGLVASLTMEPSPWVQREVTGTSFKWSIEHRSTGVVLSGQADEGVVSSVYVLPPRGFPYMSLTLDERLLLVQTLLGLPTAPGQLVKLQSDLREKDAKDRAALQAFADMAATKAPPTP